MRRMTRLTRLTERGKSRRNEKLAALTLLTFVVMMVSAGAVTYAKDYVKESGWKLGGAGAALLWRRGR